MQENSFTNIMSQRTDVELYKIVTELKDEYQPEAVVAAQLELEKRNLSNTVISDEKKN